MTLCVCEATRCNSPAGLRVYPELQGTVHMPFMFTFLHASHDGQCKPLYSLSKKKFMHSSLHLFFLFSTRFWGALRKRRGRKEEKKLLPALPPFSPEWNKAAFWGGVLSCITQQEEQGKQTGPDSSNRGSCSAGWGGTLGVNQSWTAKLVLIQREKEGSEGRNSLDRVFCLVHKRVNRKSQSGERHIPCYMKV